MGLFGAIQIDRLNLRLVAWTKLNRCKRDKVSIDFNVMFFIVMLFTRICQAQWVYTDLPDTANTRVQSLACIKENVFAATWGENKGTVFKSADSGITWSISNKGLPFSNITDLKINNGIIYVSLATEGIYFSTDYGEHWTTSNDNLKSNNVHSITIYKDTLYVVGDVSPYKKCVFRSKDNGVSWDTLGYFTTEKLFERNDSTWFIASIGKLSVSTNHGKNWHNNTFWNHSSTITEAIFVVGQNVFAGCHAETFPSTFYNGIFVSNDNGKNWSLTSDVRGEAFASSGKYIFAAGYNGAVICTENNGNTWKHVEEGFSGTNSFYSVASNDSYLFTAGNTRDGSKNVKRIWRRPISEITNVQNNIEAVKPTNFGLLQNYPNPFNPTTTIEYQVPKQSRVVVRVLDLLGREIETLVNEEESAGSYSVKFDGSSFASGVYFYQLIANGNVITKKFVLMK